MDLAASQNNDRRTLFMVLGGWSMLFVAAVFAYWPGLSGPFVFDDFGSIADLGNLGGVRDWETFKAFVFGGHAGPTGRPLALLSFLIDASNWPADAWPFKRTNLVIHLVNAALLGVLINRILQLIRVDRQEARWIALVAAGCWLLHPFLVSTTLYAVQRMAQLSTLFIFLGLVGYLHFRAFLPGRLVKAYLGMSVSIGLCTVLSAISKENGILLPLLVGVVEITVVASQRQRLASLNRYWSFAFLIVPSMVIALYLVRIVLRGDFFDIVPPRDFSSYERLLTELRILADYLKHLFVPELYTTGVFQDHVLKSTGVVQPASTALSLLLHVGVISVALLKRRAWPLFALAALFFYGSHLLESSVVKLELYFEHRNYLAAAFLFVPVIALLQQKTQRRVYVAAAAAILLLLASFTRYSATVWQDYPSMVEASARKAPTSARAQSEYATNLYNAKRYDESLQVIDRAIANIPQDVSLRLTRSTLMCNLGILNADEFQTLAGVMSARIFDPRLIKLYTTLSTMVADGRCPDVTLAALRSMFTAMLQVEDNADPRFLRYAQIKYLTGLIDVRAGDAAQARASFEDSLRSRPEAGSAMAMAALLASYDFLPEAMHFSEIALRYLQAAPASLLEDSPVLESDIMEFRANIRAEMEAGESPD